MPATSAEQSSEGFLATQHQVRFEARSAVICYGLIMAATIAAYANSLSGVFLFDDRLHILDEGKRLESLWPSVDLMTRRRPVVDYSLAVNYRVSGESVRGYHLTNVAIHLLAALALFVLVRHTMALCQKDDQRARGDPARWNFGTPQNTALAASLLWAVHPLTTQSVTYTIQRAESLMGLFYLLTLFCVLQSASSQRALAWSILAVGCCAMGMASKAVMITAPITALLFDRVFLASSWTQLIQKRKYLYLGLFATWTVLWVTGTAPAVLDPSTPKSNVGFSYKGTTAWAYAQTQCGVLLAYLRLAFWPQPLCLDYGFPTAETFGGWLFPGIPVVFLLSSVAVAIKRWPRAGFVGASFFLILAPTSSFIPIRDSMFEHRMYLPLAVVIVILVIALRALLGLLQSNRQIRSNWLSRGATVFIAVTTLSLILLTANRNRDYHSESGMWKDVLTRQPQSARAAENYGTALLAEDRPEEALPALRQATLLNPGSVEAHNGLGFALAAFGQYEEAMASFQRALRLRPNHHRALINVAHVLRDTGRLEENIAHLRGVIQRQPGHWEARLELGNTLLRTGRAVEAIEQYRQILQSNPDNLSALRNLGTALINTDKIDESIAIFLKAIQLDPMHAATYNKLGIAYASQQNTNDAVTAFVQAITLEPDSPKHYGDCAKSLLLADEYEEAITYYRKGLTLAPNDPNLQYELGVALAKSGRNNEAIAAYRRTLVLNPDDAQAASALQELLQKQGDAD